MGVFSACSKLVLVLAVLVGVGFMLTPDLLTGVSSDMTLQQWQVRPCKSLPGTRPYSSAAGALPRKLQMVSAGVPRHRNDHIAAALPYE